jgi:hypothetical protein
LTGARPLDWGAAALRILPLRIGVEHAADPITDVDAALSALEVP